MSRQVDVAIIGAGTAGLNAFRGAMGQRANALLIDPGPLGTTCARIGCMPSKLLVAAAELAHNAQRAEAFGVNAEVSIDGEAVMARLHKYRDLFVSRTLAGGVTPLVQKGKLLQAKAHFVAPGVLEADGQRIEAKAVVLAVGSWPWVPPAYRDLGDRLITNAEIFELPTLPSSLLVLGAGVMGLELGQAMQRLGVRVSVLDVAETVAGLNDPVAEAKARQMLGAELDLHLGHTLESVVRDGDEVVVRFVGADGTKHEQRFERVLAATGRRPRLDGLNLAAAGLDPLPAYNPLTGQLGESAVFMAGDVTGQRMLLHEASHEGRLAGANAARFPQLQAAPQKTPLAIAFTDPQIVQFGLGFEQLPEGTLIGEQDFFKQARAKVLGRDAGLLRVYGDAEGRLLGGVMVGPEAEHLAHQLAWLVQLGLTASQALALPFYHPVLEEGLQGALQSLDRKRGA